MAKRLAERVVAQVARALPRRAQRVLLRELCNVAAPGDAYHAFQRLGQRYGIVDLTVPGEYGVIDGALADTAVLATYAQTHQWATVVMRAVETFFARTVTGTYLDIGANIGLTTIPIARHHLVTCKAFEPEPRIFRYLIENLRRNCKSGNVETFNLALSDQRGTAVFELADDNLGDNRIRLCNVEGSFGEARRRVITVPTARLDDVVGIASLPQPIVVKMDVQGAECRVLAGGSAVLDAAAMLTFEFWPYGIRRLGSDPESLVAFITTHFATGAVLTGDRNDMPPWRPIEWVTEQLRKLVRDGYDHPYTTCEVVVRR